MKDPICERTVHPSESAAVPATGGAAITPLVALLTRHVLTDGEVVLLILKPSLWFVLLSSLRWIGVIVILGIAARIYGIGIGSHGPALIIQVGILVAALRLMWATLNWMGRYYILTDLRIVRLSGVFGVEIFECPLRKVARVTRTASVRERVVAVGSLEIIPLDENLPIGIWQMISRPKFVHQQVLTAIRRSRQGMNLD